LKDLSSDKIANFLIPTLKNSYTDATPQFKAGAAKSLCEMAEVVGKNFTMEKIMPI
jgi:hypothetical protein